MEDDGSGGGVVQGMATKCIDNARDKPTKRLNQLRTRMGGTPFESVTRRFQRGAVGGLCRRLCGKTTDFRSRTMNHLTRLFLVRVPLGEPSVGSESFTDELAINAGRSSPGVARLSRVLRGFLALDLSTSCALSVGVPTYHRLTAQNMSFLASDSLLLSPRCFGEFTPNNGSGTSAVRARNSLDACVPSR